jgi:hypothetical protein
MEVWSRAVLYQWTHEAVAFSTSPRPLQDLPVGFSCLDDLGLEQADGRLHQRVVQGLSG